MFDLFSLPTITIKVLLCEWIDNSVLVRFDSAVCNQIKRTILIEMYSKNWFVLEDDHSINIKNFIKLLEFDVYEQKLDWFLRRGIHCKCLHILISGKFGLSSNKNTVIESCSENVTHLVIRCEVGYDIWRRPINDYNDEWKELLFYYMNKFNYIPPDKIPDGFISESDFGDILSKCPNLTDLSIHNVGSVSKEICKKYLSKLIQFDVSQSFQPLITLSELKKLLHYVDPLVEYEKQQYADYLATNEALLKRYELDGESFTESEEDQVKFYISSVNQSSNNDLENYVTFDDSLGICNSVNEIETLDYQWYETSYDMNSTITNLCAVCPKLVEISPGVYKSLCG